MIETIRLAMEWVALALDIFAVIIIVAGAVIAAFRCRLLRTLVSPDLPGVVSGFKHQLISSLLLGLDLLVASDVINTVAVDLTFNGVATLGLLVMVRIALTWSLIVESEGRWPWQPRSVSGDASTRSG